MLGGGKNVVSLRMEIELRTNKQTAYLIRRMNRIFLKPLDSNYI
jgi:hypothetical protein